MRTVAFNYPNEVFIDKLYLGNFRHAMDANVIENLGITHILNISDTCENYLEQSHRKFYFSFILISLFKIPAYVFARQKGVKD